MFKYYLNEFRTLNPWQFFCFFFHLLTFISSGPKSINFIPTIHHIRLLPVNNKEILHCCFNVVDIYLNKWERRSKAEAILGFIWSIIKFFTNYAGWYANKYRRHFLIFRSKQTCRENWGEKLFHLVHNRQKYLKKPPKKELVWRHFPPVYFSKM
jgi:hypothetical protein